MKSIDYLKEEIEEYLILEEENIRICLDSLDITCTDYIILDTWKDEQFIYLLTLFYSKVEPLQPYILKEIKVLRENPNNVVYSYSDSIGERMRAIGNKERLINELSSALINIKPPSNIVIPSNLRKDISYILKEKNLSFWYFVSGTGLKYNVNPTLIQTEAFNNVDSGMTITIDYDYPLGEAPSDTVQFLCKGKVVNIKENFLYKNYKVTTSKSKYSEWKILDYWEDKERLNLIILAWDDETIYIDVVRLTLEGDNIGAIEYIERDTILSDRLINSRMASFKLLRWCITNVKFPCFIELPTETEMEPLFLNLMNELGREYKKEEPDNIFRGESISSTFLIGGKGPKVKYVILPIELNTVIQMYQMEDI